MSPHGPSADEETPLLSDNNNSSTSADQPYDTPPTTPPPHPKFLRVATICLISFFLIEVGDYMIRAPTARILEDVVCRAYYEVSPYPTLGVDLSRDIPEQYCKGSAVQGEVAMLKGIDEALSCIPGILLAVPYGVLADKYGRKMVLLLSLLGLTLDVVWTQSIAAHSNVIPIKWIWAGNLFILIGGGSAVVKAMFFAMLADVATEDQRTKVFFRLMAAGLISTIVGIPVSWALMKVSMWLAVRVGTAMIVVGALTIFFMPETLERSKVPDPTLLQEEELPTDGDDPEGDAGSLHAEPPVKKQVARFAEKVKDWHFLFASPILPWLSITFLLQSVSGVALSLLFQLASERFHWGLGDASFLIPISSTATFIVLVVLLPALYSFLTTRFNMLPAVKDLLVARGSLVFLVIGALIIAWAPLPGLFVLGTLIVAFGCGFSSATRSLATSLVHTDEVSRLYAIIAVLDTVGRIGAASGLSAAFRWGVNLGGNWSGIPYIVCAIAYTVFGLPVWLVKRPTREMDVQG